MYPLVLRAAWHSHRWSLWKRKWWRVFETGWRKLVFFTWRWGLRHGPRSPAVSVECFWAVWFHSGGKSWFIMENSILTKMGWLGGSLILGNLHVWCVLNMKRCARISSSSPEKKSVVLDKSNPLLAARSNAWAVHYVHCLQGGHPSDWDHLWSSMGIPPTPEVTSPKEWMVLGCSGGEPERGSQEEGAAFLEEVTGSLGLKTVAVKR